MALITQMSLLTGCIGGSVSSVFAGRCLILTMFMSRLTSPCQLCSLPLVLALRLEPQICCHLSSLLAGWRCISTVTVRILWFQWSNWWRTAEKFIRSEKGLRRTFCLVKSEFVWRENRKCFCGYWQIQGGDNQDRYRESHIDLSVSCSALHTCMQNQQWTDVYLDPVYHYWMDYPCLFRC